MSDKNKILTYSDINVSDGCQSDCRRLIDNFVVSAKVSNSTSFPVFAEEWQKARFNLIFCGREELVELSELIKQLFVIVKDMLMEPVSLVERIGALYLCYALYYKQEKTCNKFRFTLAEFAKVLDIMEELKHNSHEEGQFVFYQLLVDNAFHFTATPAEFNYVNVKDNARQEAEKAQRPESDLLNKLNDTTMRELEVIHSYYIRVKTSVPGLSNQQASKAQVNADFVKEVHKQLEGLKTNMRLSRGEAAKRAKTTQQQSDSNDEDSDDLSSSDEDIGERRRLLRKKSLKKAEPYRLPGSRKIDQEQE